MMNKIKISLLAVVLTLVSCVEEDLIPVPEQPAEDRFEMSSVPDCVPVVEVTTAGGVDIVSKDEYIVADITVKEDNVLTLKASGRVKGRGNYTWHGYPKKPYKIKFDEKQGICGFPENKDWVLLADYCDKSLLRTAYMCDISEALEVDYPVRYRHVNLFLNGEYKGVYVLTDQVEKKKHRVDIEDDGFLFENDNYAWDEPLQFVTETREYLYSFKYPDPEDGEIVSGDEKYEFITGFMNDMEAALYSDGFRNPVSGYRKYIDVRSFVKWYIVAELTANHDPNLYYVIPERGAKLQIGPLWDSEWSLGVSYRSGPTTPWAVPPFKPDFHQEIWCRWKYFGRLFQDSYFKSEARNEWELFKKRIPALKEKWERLAASLSEVQAMNFARWPVLGTYLGASLVCLETWEDEVRYNADFFDERVKWMDEFLSEL